MNKSKCCGAEVYDAWLTDKYPTRFRCSKCKEFCELKEPKVEEPFDDGDVGIADMICQCCQYGRTDNICTRANPYTECSAMESWKRYLDTLYKRKHYREAIDILEKLKRNSMDRYCSHIPATLNEHIILWSDIEQIAEALKKEVGE